MRRLSRPELPSAVVDTNVFVSGSISHRGYPFQLLEAWRRGLFAVVLSEEQRGELEDVFARAEIAGRFRVSEEDQANLFFLLRNVAVSVSLRRQLPVEVRDVKDEKILAAALAGADYLVTGDNDLLTLDGNPELGGLRIVTVREFVETLGAGPAPTDS